MSDLRSPNLLLSLSFIKIQFTYYNIYPFKMHSSVVFSLFRVVQPWPLHKSQTFSSPQKEVSPDFLFLSVSMGLLILDTWYKWNHTICGCFLYFFFPLSTMLSQFIHVVPCIRLYSVCCCWIIFYCMDVPLWCIHVLVDGHSDWFIFLF